VGLLRLLRLLRLLLPVLPMVLPPLLLLHLLLPLLAVVPTALLLLALLLHLLLAAGRMVERGRRSAPPASRQVGSCCSGSRCHERGNACPAHLPVWPRARRSHGRLAQLLLAAPQGVAHLGQVAGGRRQPPVHC
jgi:hypothetical protein